MVPETITVNGYVSNDVTSKTETTRKIRIIVGDFKNVVKDKFLIFVKAELPHAQQVASMIINSWQIFFLLYSHPLSTLPLSPAPTYSEVNPKHHNTLSVSQNVSEEPRYLFLNNHNNIVILLQMNSNYLISSSIVLLFL